MGSADLEVDATLMLGALVSGAATPLHNTASAPGIRQGSRSPDQRAIKPAGAERNVSAVKTERCGCSRENTDNRSSIDVEQEVLG